MSLNTAALNGADYGAMYSAAVTSVNNLGGGTYSVDGTEYGGSFFDFSNPAVPAGNVVSTQTHAYNPLLAPGIISFQYTYGDGHMPPAFGGVVLGYNQNTVLVQQIDGFVPVDQVTGTYAGTLDAHSYLILGSWGNNLSFEANGGNGPTLPIDFGQTGPFFVPEPGTYALVLLALLACTVVRLPLFRRFRQGHAA
jgi:PEP-CTERM motif